MPDPVDPKDPKDPVKPPADPPKPKKIELTEDEYQAQLAAAAEKERKKWEKKVADDKAAADADAKKKAGEYQTLYESEAAKTKAKDTEIADMKLNLRKMQVESMLRDHLAAKHADYVGSVKYMLPLLTVAVDTSDEDAAKQIAEAATKFVADNPRATGKGTPVPPNRGTPPDGVKLPTKPDGTPIDLTNFRSKTARRFGAGTM